MRIWSTNFEDGGMIPSSFCLCRPDPIAHATFAANRNPHLVWEGVPDDARSLALICVDPDAPTVGDAVNVEGMEVPADLPRGDFYHWLAVDLSVDATSIAEGSCADGVVTGGKNDRRGPHGSMQGINDYTGWFAGDPDMEGRYLGYDGPCPPWNDSIVHRYVFTLYALDLPALDVPDEFGGADVVEAMRGHVLAEASLTGRYTLNPDLA